MFNKRSIELSLNFIVIFIISVIIFGFGIKFISNLSSEATELQEITISELDQRIGNLVCEGADRVCIGIDRKTIKRSNFDVFGIKIINILDSPDFEIKVSPSSPAGFKKDKSPISSSNLIVIPKERTINIEKNEEKSFAIGIQVPQNAVSGTYIFNVEITEKQNGNPYSPIQKLYVDVP